MRRSTLLLLVATLTTFSCTKTSVSVRENVPIDFSPYITKAGDTFKAAGSKFETGDEIGMFAYYHPGTTFSDASTPDFMLNQQLSCVRSSWRYSPVKYWPAEYDGQNGTDRLSFLAYYPYASRTAADTTGIRFLSADGSDYSEHSPGLPVISFTQKDLVNSQIDLMLSDFREGTERNITQFTCYGAVNLVFSHALALVSFKLLDVEGMDMVVKSMTLSGVKGSGTCTLAAGPETLSYTWAPSGADKTYSIQRIEDARLLLIPQDITDDVILRVEYDLTFEGADKDEHGIGSTITYPDNICEVPLTLMVDRDGNTVRSNITSWVGGKKYTYRINPGLDRIEFGETVEASWTDTDTE